MINARKLEALRNLAERPGTEAEGKVAREMLAKLEAKSQENPSAEDEAAIDAIISRDGQFVAGKDNFFVTSRDGITWSTVFESRRDRQWLK